MELGVTDQELTAAFLQCQPGQVFGFAEIGIVFAKVQFFDIIPRFDEGM